MYWVRLMGLASVLLAAFCGTSIATAQEGEPAAEPASKWTLRSGENHCAIVRRFGEERPTHLQIRKFPGDYLLEITVLGGDVDVRNDGADVVARFEPGPDLYTVGVPFSMRSKVGPGLLFRGDIKLGDEDPAAATSDRRESAFSNTEVLELSGAFYRPVRLRTRSMAGAMKLLEECVDRIEDGWGIQPATSPPEPVNFEQWSRKLVRDYPPAASMIGIQGSVRTMLVIDPDGTVSHCFAQLPVRDTILQDHACQALKDSGEFEPARNAEGAPVRQLMPFEITYQLD